MDILHEGKNNLLIFLGTEDKYMPKIIEVLKSIDPKIKLCYVCVSTTYDDALSEFEFRGIKKERLFFIDTLTSHYQKHRKTKTCMFVSSPANLNEIQDTMKKAIIEKGCKIVIFDSVSKLLTYTKPHSIIRLAHKIVIENTKTKTIFILLKSDNIPQEENKQLIKDLAMFADKVIDLDASLIL